MLIRNYQDLFSFFQEMAAKPAVLQVSAAGVYLPEGRHPIIPFFQHSIIPIAERSGAKFSKAFADVSHASRTGEKRKKLRRSA